MKVDETGLRELKPQGCQIREPQSNVLPELDIDYDGGGYEGD